MKIKIYGKAHIQGTSKKTGREYNLTVLHTLMPARGVDGLAARTIMVDAAQNPIQRFAVNADYDVEFDNTGYPISILPCNK